MEGEKKNKDAYTPTWQKFNMLQHIKRVNKYNHPRVMKTKQNVTCLQS